MIFSGSVSSGFWASLIVCMVFPWDHFHQLFEAKFFPDGSVIKNPPANLGYMGSIPGIGRSPGEENGNLLWYSCLENPMERGAWQATVHGVAKELDMTQRLKQQQQTTFEAKAGKADVSPEYL